jgi:ribonuclease HI
VNVDDNSQGNPGMSGFGGLIRNKKGHWMASFSGFYGFGSNLHPELLAIKHGLVA